jgi:hypothetical protein
MIRFNNKKGSTMKDSYYCYAKIDQPIPADFTPGFLTELSKTGWELAIATPVQFKTSNLANTPAQQGFMIIIRKERPINAQPIAADIEIGENGIIVHDKPIERG